AAGEIPALSQVSNAFAVIVSSGELGSAVWATLLVWLGGIGVASMLGVPIGIAIGLSRWADAAVGPLMDFLRPIPAVAFVPLAIILFGLELRMQMFLVALACIWPIVLGTRHGVRSVDPLQIDTARAFGLSRVDVTRRVILPSTFPAVVT